MKTWIYAAPAVKGISPHVFSTEISLPSVLSIFWTINPLLCLLLWSILFYVTLQGHTSHDWSLLPWLPAGWTLTSYFQHCSRFMKATIQTQNEHWVLILNPSIAGAAYIRVFIFYQHIKYHILNMLKIKCDINQQDLKRVDLQFVKSE